MRSPALQLADLVLRGPDLPRARVRRGFRLPVLRCLGDRGDSGCRYCDASAIGGPSYDGEACPSIQSLGAALAADEGCDGMTYTRNYAEGTPHECRCDSYCDDFCDDGPNGCARTCRILNGVFEHIPSVHAGDRTCTWYAHYVTNPINYEGYDCSWMTGTGEGGHGDDCQDWTSAGALKCREGNQNQNNCHF
ncbi:unnamed protein product [Prorocentrum cordatum]|uniref:Uncharacterized protein n=1 Tax=Prorocentrum cordatum TaxID=2364126 RepID=A0ABN9TIC6_9DINO|nr:unnamed protein product [Polarella glacialis]